MADYWLTGPERVVVTLLAHGLTNVEIAARLGVSPHTSKSRLRLVAKRWGTHTSAGLVGLAYRSGAIYADETPAEDVWTTRLRANGYELERIPERRDDRRLDAYQRRDEDR